MPAAARHLAPAGPEGDKPAKKTFAACPIGFFRLDLAEGRAEEGKLCRLVALDRTSKFAVARLYTEAARPTACQFLEELLEMVPYRSHTLLTDHGIQFAEQPRNRNTILSRQSRFDMICEAHGIEHRLTRPNHPWTNGQVERMNRTIKDATTKRYHYEDHEQLRRHLELFLHAYNQARRLKTLKGLTPAQFIRKEWQSRPEPFFEEPCHLMTGPNS